MQPRCVKCGETFTCGAATGSCWCMDLPRVMPIPFDGDADCYCPRCLMEKQGLITLAPVTVAYIRQVGPYGSAIQPLWVKLRDWAQSRGLWNEFTISYGISHDSPMDTAPENCRYDAGIEVPVDFEFDRAVQRANLPGGMYATLGYTGKADDVCNAFGETLHRVIPALGKQFDYTRPMFERYAGNVNVEPNGTFNCDICVPVK